MKRNARLAVSFFIFLIWFGFTVSLSVWWFIFGMRQLDRVSEIVHARSPELLRYQQMLMWEGGTLVISLFLGGAALAYFMFRAISQRDALERFFATFTHELKTPIASLQLQAETLQESCQHHAHGVLISRLVSDTARLTLQLDNSLFLADRRERRMVKERLVLSEILDQIRPHWPTLTLELPRDCNLVVDRRAFLSIVQNLIQNAAAHGKASGVIFAVEAGPSGLVRLRITDNGSGFMGDLKGLGRLYRRFYSGSGSGIGLYLAKQLAHDLGGSLDFEQRDKSGLTAVCLLPGELL